MTKRETSLEAALQDLLDEVDDAPTRGEAEQDSSLLGALERWRDDVRALAEQVIRLRGKR